MEFSYLASLVKINIKLKQILDMHAELNNQEINGFKSLRKIAKIVLNELIFILFI